MEATTASVIPTAGGVFALIRNGVVSTRAEVAAVTGLSRTAVTARLSALLRAGLIVEGEEAPSTGGRPPTLLRFNAEAGYVLAVALGRSRTQMAVCDLDGVLVRSSEFDHSDGLGPDEMLPRVRKALEKLLREAGGRADQVRGVGLSLPGTVDIDEPMSVASPIMRGWDRVPLAPYFADLRHAAIRVENDANALAFSEVSGHLRSHPNMLVLKASTGLSCGVFADGRLIRGALGAAGELGHTKTAAAAGRVCRCGDVGCLEAVAGGWALVQDWPDDAHPVSHVRDLVARAVDGNPQARRSVRESGRRVGEVLAGAVNLLNPSALVLGGDLAGAYEIFLAGLRETLYAGATALESNGLEILPSTHGASAGLIGCAQAAVADVLSPAAIDQALRAEGAA